MDNVKDILAAVRCRKGYTHERIAKELGIATTTHLSYERGVALPPIKVLSKLSDIYGLNTDQLIGRSPIRRQDIDGMETPISKSDLKDFTKAAMQGLCQAAGIEIIQHGGLTERQEKAIAYAALSIAERTLSELQNQQS